MSADLLGRIAAGSRADSDAAFSELVSVWQGPLTGLAFKMLRDWQQAEDVFSSVMLTVFQHAGNFREIGSEKQVTRTKTTLAIAVQQLTDEDGSADPPSFGEGSSFRRWIYSITERRCIDVIRKRRNDALSHRVEPTDDFDPTSTIVDVSRPPIDTLAEREELDEIAVAMDAIPDDQRAVLELFNEGFSFNEIADASGANPHTTKRRAQLARGKVRDGVIQSRMRALVEKMFA